jgi:ADP-heptose:LPS heptosyltransferase
MNLPLLFSLIDRMALVISPDTGVAHIAAAADVPQVVLYADKLFNPIVWKPLSDKLTALIPNSGPTVNDLPPDQIAAAAVQLIPARKEPMPAMS